MRICGATETALVLYRDKLPKFNNNGRMILDWFAYDRGGNYPKIHPTQKPVSVLKQLIEIYTDPYDVVISRKCKYIESLCRIRQKLLWV